MPISLSMRQLPYYFCVILLEDLASCFNLILVFDIGETPFLKLQWRRTVAVTANLSYQCDQFVNSGQEYQNLIL